MVFRCVVLAAILAVPNTSAAAEEAAAPEAEKKLLRDHAKQGFVNVAFGTGFYLVAPKEKNDPQRSCETETLTGENGYEGKPICVGRSAMHLEFLGGYGVLPRFEVFAIFRLGVEQPENGRFSERQIGAGVKIYSPADGLFKIGIGVAPLFDFSERASAVDDHVDLGYDFVIHVPIQFQFDIVRWVGVYAELAPNISFITEVRLDISMGIGVQARFP